MCSSPFTSLLTRVAGLCSAAGGLISPVQRLSEPVLAWIRRDARRAEPVRAEPWPREPALEGAAQRSAPPFLLSSWYFRAISHKALSVRAAGECPGLSSGIVLFQGLERAGQQPPSSQPLLRAAVPGAVLEEGRPAGRALKLKILQQQPFLHRELQDRAQIRVMSCFLAWSGLIGAGGAAGKHTGWVQEAGEGSVPPLLLLSRGATMCHQKGTQPQHTELPLPSREHPRLPG